MGFIITLTLTHKLTNKLAIKICLKWLSLASLKARSESSVKLSQNFIFDARLRFALLASLRSAIFSKNKEDS